MFQHHEISINVLYYFTIQLSISLFIHGNEEEREEGNFYKIMCADVTACKCPCIGVVPECVAAEL